MTTKDPAILFVKPGAIKEGDIAVLKHIGVTVVEIDDPSSVKFTRPSLELSGNDVLVEALRIINDKNISGSGAREALANAVGAAITAQVKR